MNIQTKIQAAYTLDYVPPAQLESVFPKVQGFLQGVVERSGGRWTLASLITDILAGKFSLLAICSANEIKGVVATHLHTTSSGMIVCQVPFATGHDSKEWVHLIGIIEDYARKNGAAKIEMWSRPGWSRKHKAALAGFECSHLLLEKDLT